MGLIWRGDEVLARARELVSKRLEMAGRVLTNHAKVNMGRAHAVQTFQSAAKRRRRAERKLSRGMELTAQEARAARSELREMTAHIGGQRYYRDPSRPGEYPKRATGTLRESIAFAFTIAGRGTEIIWGTNVPYGRHLQIGTRKMAPRPWMSRTNAECLPELQRILGGPLSMSIEGVEVGP